MPQFMSPGVTSTLSATYTLYQVSKRVTYSLCSVTTMLPPMHFVIILLAGAGGRGALPGARPARWPPHEGVSPPADHIVRTIQPH